MDINEKYLKFIETLYIKNASLLFNYANIILSNASLAEEAVQETFVIACIKQHALENSPNPEGWLMNTLKNVCRNIQKNRNYYLSRILSLNESVLGTTALESDNLWETNVQDFISKEDFMILKKIILDGYSYKDLAKELGISLEACKKRAQRAKQRFRKNYDKNNHHIDSRDRI
ncbi:RNA polymerase sigma factor [Anaerotignum lactatifermentans]|uniref:RNA polymerase sigma factor n=1 Tax=Anaerotignum lactatifermentans TaxID=160404 RepID=UPI0024B0DB61|nr:sigma-70 family RNA polymerase sigma factor [Anaerotignum lactatifermentans]